MRKGAFPENKGGTSRPLAARLHIAQTWSSTASLRPNESCDLSVEPFRSRLSGPASALSQSLGAMQIASSVLQTGVGFSRYSSRPALASFFRSPPPPSFAAAPAAAGGRGQCRAPHAYADNLPPPSILSSSPPSPPPPTIRSPPHLPPAPLLVPPPCPSAWMCSSQSPGTRQLLPRRRPYRGKGGRRYP